MSVFVARDFVDVSVPRAGTREPALHGCPAAIFVRRRIAPPFFRGVHEGVHTLKTGCSEMLIGAPRFELGTPCTPCKCATRLRHAPTDCSSYRRRCRRHGASYRISSALTLDAPWPADPHSPRARIGREAMLASPVPCSKRPRSHARIVRTIPVWLERRGGVDECAAQRAECGSAPLNAPLSAASA